MDNTWYYAIDGVRHGPVGFDELKRLAETGGLNPLDLVWHPGFGPEWRNVSQVAGLIATPPPLKAQPPVRDAEARAVEAPVCGVCGDRPSAVRAAVNAFDHMVEVLFRQFDFVRWMSIGFCAWLAYLGSQGSANFDVFRGELSTNGMKADLDKALDALQLSAIGSTKLTAMAVALLMVIVFGLIFCQLRSRGDFMFLHRWYRPDAPITLCWTASREAGAELFKWRVYFFLIAVLLYVLDGVFAYRLVLKPYLEAGKVWDEALLLPTIACVGSVVLLTVVSEVVAHLAKAFVVPVMYWQGVTASRAWLAVFSLCNQYPFAMLSYLIFGVVCSVLAGVLFVLVGVLTCCIGFIPMILPYFGTVVLLPYYFFFRGYAVCFLNQWRADLVPASA